MHLYFVNTMCIIFIDRNTHKIHKIEPPKTNTYAYGNYIDCILSKDIKTDYYTLIDQLVHNWQVALY